MPPNPDALRSLRRYHQMTQRDLANLSGVSRETIIALEQDGSRAKSETVHALAQALGVDPIWLGQQLGNAPPLPVGATSS